MIFYFCDKKNCFGNLFPKIAFILRISISKYEKGFLIFLRTKYLEEVKYYFMPRKINLWNFIQLKRSCLCK